MKAKDYIAGKQKPKRSPRKLVDRGKDLQDYLMSAHGFDRKVARQVVEQLDRVMPEKTTQAHRRQMLADIIADAFVDKLRSSGVDVSKLLEMPGATQTETAEGIEVRVPIDIHLTQPMYEATITGVDDDE